MPGAISNLGTIESPTDYDTRWKRKSFNCTTTIMIKDRLPYATNGLLMRSKRIENFVVFFLIAIVPFLIFIATYGVFYFTISTWADNPARHFAEIKATLDNYGDLTEAEREQLENQSITQSTANKAVSVAQPDFFDSLAPAVLPIATITAIYYAVRLAFRRKMLERSGEKTDRASIGDKSAERHGGSSSNQNPPGTFPNPPTRINFFKDFNQTVLTVDGLIITIIAGFLIAEGPKHFITIYGFLVLIASMISAFIAHSLISSSIISENGGIHTLAGTIAGFYDASHYAFWYFVLGLLIIIGSLI